MQVATQTEQGIGSTMSVKDRLSELNTSEVSNFLRHDLRSLMTINLIALSNLGVLEVNKYDSLLKLPTLNPEIKELLKKHLIRGDQTYQSFVEAEIERPGTDILDKNDPVLPKRYLGYKEGSFINAITEKSVGDIINSGDQSLAQSVIDLVLTVQNTGVFIPDSAAAEEKEKTAVSRQLLSVFADSVYFFQDPSDERLVKLKNNRINLGTLCDFFRGDISYKGDTNMEVDGIEVVILANLINNAVQHGLTERHPRVIVDVKNQNGYHSISVDNYSKEQLSDEKMRPGETSKLDKEGKKIEGAGYGLAIAQTLAEVNGLKFVSNSARVENEEAYLVTVTLSNQPKNVR